MARRFLIPLCLAASACAGEEADPPQNESARITGQIERQAAEIVSQAENGTAAIERALENEGAAVFDNRAALLNEGAADRTR